MTEHGLRALVAVTLAATLALAGAAEARVYRSVDAEGNVTYSDRPPAVPTSPATDREAQVDELLELSGLKRQFQRMPADIRMRMQQQAQASRSEAQERIAAAFARAFTAEAIESRVRGVVVARFDPAHAEAYATWLRGPVSRRLNEVEAASESRSGQEQLARYAATLQKVPPPPDRAAVARRLVEATGVVDISLDVVLGMARAMALAVDAAQPPDKRLKPGQLDAQIRATREQAYEPMRVNAVIQMLFTYRTLPREDLEAYADFYASPPAKWFLEAARRGLIDAITGLTERAIADVGPAALTAPRR